MFQKQVKPKIIQGIESFYTYVTFTLHAEGDRQKGEGNHSKNLLNNNDCEFETQRICNLKPPLRYEHFTLDPSTQLLFKPY